MAQQDLTTSHRVLDFIVTSVMEKNSAVFDFIKIYKVKTISAVHSNYKL